LRNRILRAIEAGRRAVAPRGDAGRNPDAMQASLALLLMGQADGELGTRARGHAEAARQATAIPLLITSSTELTEIKTPGLVYEYLPATSDVLEATGELPEIAALYALRRLELIFDKWLVVECRWCGQDAEELLSLRQRRPELARSRIKLARLG
jgi:hypothetical protein